MKNHKDNFYSIGYGNRTIEEFFKILHEHNITYLIDVRSVPYSKRKPEFEKNQLDIYAKVNKINYIFMGDSLGGRPVEEEEYSNGKVDYSVLKKNDKFKYGLQYLVNSYNGKLNVALMCSELKPEDCHRSKLIGRELKKLGIEILHIDENENTKSQEDVMNIVTKGFGDYDLFGEKPLSSRKKYNQ